MISMGREADVRAVVVGKWFGLVGLVLFYTV